MSRPLARAAPAEPRVEFLAGVKAMLPLLLGAIPFGVTYGVLAFTGGLGVPAALGMSSVVFAGSAQFVAVQLFAIAAPAVVIIATTFMVNLRHALYSASLSPHLKHLRSLWKWTLSYLLTDEAYAVTIVRYDRLGTSPNGHWFFLGAGLTMWTAWQASTAAGIFLGEVIPRNWPLDFAITLTFIALLVPMLKDRLSVGVSLTAGMIAILAINLPLRLNLILAVIIAVVIGVAIERIRR